MGYEEAFFSPKLFAFLQNLSLNNIIVGFMPDDELKPAVMKLLRCCNAHGVRTETVLKIAMDFAKEEGLDE